MRRADRLFQIIQMLRRRKGATTARQLAERLSVSERTIYRDMGDLSLSGVPIEAEAGVGYMLRDYDLPPVMFTEEEIEALVLGARIVQSWTDEQLAAAARGVLEKVEIVLPEALAERMEKSALVAPSEHARVEMSVDFVALRKAIQTKQKIRFQYTDAGGGKTRRTVQPLFLAFYGPVWNVAAWCELREDYRGFRPDRMTDMEVLDESFTPRPTDDLPGWMTSSM